MTKIKIYKNISKLVYGFECVGHTGYADNGKDIVCAGISALTQTAVLGLTKLKKFNLKITQDDKNAVLKIMISKKQMKYIADAQEIFETMILGLYEISKQYSNYVKLEEQYENV